MTDTAFACRYRCCQIVAFWMDETLVSNYHGLLMMSRLASWILLEVSTLNLAAQFEYTHVMNEVRMYVRLKYSIIVIQIFV